MNMVLDCSEVLCRKLYLREGCFEKGCERLVNNELAHESELSEVERPSTLKLFESIIPFFVAKLKLLINHSQS